MRGVERDELAAALAVEPHEAVGLLDDAVRLAGDDVAVLGEADVHALAAALQREQHGARGACRGGSDRHRPLEPRNRPPKRLDQVVVHRVGVARHQCRDHLGVGGDRAREAQPVRHLEIGVVVDVAVEHADEVVATRVLGAPELVLFAVDRVGVGLGDDPDAGPTGVPQHRDLGRVVAEREAQQPIAGDGSPHRRRVVAELADLGGGLVDERQDRSAVGAVDHPHRAVLEQGITVAVRDRRADRGVVDVETVVPDEQVDARRIASADLHAVDRRERQLHGEVAGAGCTGWRLVPPRRRPRERSGADRDGSPTARRAMRSMTRSPVPARRRRARPRRARLRRAQHRPRRRRRRAGRGAP